MKIAKYLFITTIMAGGIGFGPASFAGPTTPERLLNADNEPQNWLMTRGNYASWHYSKLGQINKSNVANLRVAFMASIGGNGVSTIAQSKGNEMSSPLIEDGFMYTIDSLNKVMKFDVRSGSRALPIWRYDPQVTKFRQYQNTRGMALWQNMIIEATRDARLVGIDKQTGEKIYEVSAREAPGVNPPEAIETRELGGDISIMRTAAGKNIAVVGSGGGGIGWIAAHNPENGKEIWRTYTIPQPGEPNFGTWKGETWKSGSVMPWGPASFDPESNTIYIGTGEPSPVYDPEFRPGDNLYSVSSLALDADTGKIKWFFQEVPNDQNDYDSTGARMIIDYKGGDGVIRKAVTNWARNGFTYTLDRANGQFIHGIAQGDNISWTKGLDPKTGKPLEYNPSVGVQTYAVAGPRRGRAEKDAPAHCNTWGGAPTGIWPPSYDPTTGVTYQTRTSGCTYQTIQKTTDENFQPWARENLGSVVKQVQVNTLANLVAIDVNKAKIVNTYTYDQGIPSTRQAEAGALATGGGLVFTGWADGTFAAYDKDTLVELWRFNTGTNLKGAAVTYSVNGKQFVAHIAGGSAHTSGVADLIMPTAMLVVYALP